MSEVKEKSVKLYILKYIYREVRDQVITTQVLYKNGSEILGIPRKQLGNWLHLFVNEELMERVEIVERGKKVRGYRITQKGCQFINCGITVPIYKPKRKVDYCYLCNCKEKLFLYRGQYYCGKCMRGGEGETYNLEDYVYNGPGYIW
jgi:hypothetical protein